MFPIALPGLLSLAVQYAPGLLDLVFGGKVGQTAEKVAKVAKSIFGTDDPQKVQTAIAADPGITERFKAEIEAETEQLRLELEDKADARRMGVQLVKSGHWTSNMPAIVVLLIMGFYFTCTAALFFISIEIPERMFQLIMIAYGTLGNAFGVAISYYLGTTRQNAAKDEQNTALASALQQHAANVIPLRKAA